MNRNFTAIILTYFIISTVASAQNADVSDYQVPVSSAQALRFDGSWNWSQNGNSVTANNMNGTLLYRTFFTSLPLAWFLNIDGAGGKSLGSPEPNYNVSVDLSFRKYIINEEDYFAFTRILAKRTDVYKQIASDLTLGFGYGRYINATALAKAVRIEEHLLRDEAIAGYLPKEALIAIANIIERENEYKDLYGVTYETFWFDDIENQIADAEMDILGGIGSIGILRMRQVLFGINERVNERYYGWDVSAGILFPLTTPDKSPVGNPNLTINGRYSYPISWRTQINSTGEVFTPIDSLLFKKVTARTGLDFIYELSNRINFVAGYRLGLTKSQSTEASADHTLNASFWYYIENNIYLTINGNLVKQPNTPQKLSSAVGLQYNLF